MITRSPYLEAPPRLRAFVRAHETSLVILAAIVGAIGGLVVAAMSAAVDMLHMALFDLRAGDRLSSQVSIDPVRALLVPSLGGFLLGIAFLLLARWRPAREIDPIEANALHGGRMSFRGSVIVALETVWSSGVGASVGLEAGYTQLSSGLGASLGRGFHLRRADQRLMVGCGTAAAIAGAFSAPLAGAFYAFELVIGGYTPASLTPVGVASVVGYFVAHAFAPLSLGVGAGPVGDVLGRDLAVAALLGVFAALFGITIMRGAGLCESLLSKIVRWPPLRPALGGLAVGTRCLALQRDCHDATGVYRHGVRAEDDSIRNLARRRLPRRLVFRHAFSGRNRRASFHGRSRRHLAGAPPRPQPVRHHRDERAIG